MKISDSTLRVVSHSLLGVEACISTCRCCVPYRDAGVSCRRCDICNLNDFTRYLFVCLYVFKLVAHGYSSLPESSRVRARLP